MAKKQKKVAKKNATKPAAKNGVGINPLSDKVLIKPEPAETQTAAGIFIPDTAKSEKATTGTVIAVGEGRYADDGARIPMTVTVGQKVYFNPGWENNELEWKGEKYFLVSESDIKAILD